MLESIFGISLDGAISKARKITGETNANVISAYKHKHTKHYNIMLFEKHIFDIQPRYLLVIINEFGEVLRIKQFNKTYDKDYQIKEIANVVAKELKKRSVRNAKRK